MNDFAYLAGAHRGADQRVDLITLSLRLSRTPCGPLYGSHISPDRETIAILQPALPMSLRRERVLARHRVFFGTAPLGITERSYASWLETWPPSQRFAELTQGG